MRLSGFRRHAGTAFARAGPVLLLAAASLPLMHPSPAAAADDSGDPLRISYLRHEALVHDRHFPEGAGVLIRLFATEGASQGRAAKTDDEYVIRATEAIRESAPLTLAHEIERHLRKLKTVPWVTTGSESKWGPAVIIEGRFTLFDTGHRGGFGNQARVSIEGTIRGPSGETLVEFQFGQVVETWLLAMTTDPVADHLSVLSRATRKLGKDIAKLMKRWMKGDFE